MATLKYDVSGQDHNQARGKALKPIKPGVYRAKISQLTLSKPKGKDRRIEVVVNIQHKDYPGKPPLYDYINVESEAAGWKLDQFLQALGVDTNKKAKGSLNLDKYLGKTVKVQVANEADNRDGHEGESRAKLKTWLADSDDEDDETEDSDDEDEDLDDEEEEDDEDPDEDEEGDDSDEDEEDSEDEEPEDEEEEEAEDYNSWAIADLKRECEARDLSAKGKKSSLVERLEEYDRDNPFED